LLPFFRRVSRPENAKSLADAAVSEALEIYVRARVYNNAARTGPQAFDDDDDEIMKAFI